jgi:hypothetical protein
MSDGMDPLALLQYLQQQPGGLEQYFEPYQQEQDVLNKHMGLAQGLMQGGPQHTSPLGALLGGLSDAAGKLGGNYLQQKDLGGLTQVGQHMQGDAAGRLRALLQAIQASRVGAGDVDPSSTAGLT